METLPKSEFPDLKVMNIFYSIYPLIISLYVTQRNLVLGVGAGGDGFLMNFLSEYAGIAFLEDSLTIRTKIKNVTTLNAGEDEDKRNLSSIAGGNVNYHRYLGNSLGISLKIKTAITICPLNHTLEHLSQRN